MREKYAVTLSFAGAAPDAPMYLSAADPGAAALGAVEVWIEQYEAQSGEITAAALPEYWIAAVAWPPNSVQLFYLTAELRPDVDCDPWRPGEADKAVFEALLSASARSLISNGET